MAAIGHIHNLQTGGSGSDISEVAIDIYAVGKARNGYERQGGRGECADYTGGLSREAAIGDGYSAGAVGSGRYVSVWRAKITDGEVAGRIVCPFLGRSQV